MEMNLPLDAVLVSYDISDDRRRRRAARLLGSHGWKAVYSGFLIPSDSDLDDVMVDLREMIAPTDLVMATPWCSSCGILTLGVPIEQPPRSWMAA